MIPAVVVRHLDGPAGSADLVEAAPGVEVPSAWAATIAAWFLTCPRQSPGWSHYLLSVVHLRDMPDVPPAAIVTLGATHEVHVIALDPSKSPNALDLSSWRFLYPINVAHQVVLNDDGQAFEVAELAARAVTEGMLWAEPPLSGQTEPWAGTLDTTAAHLRTGGRHE